MRVTLRQLRDLIFAIPPDYFPRPMIIEKRHLKKYYKIKSFEIVEEIKFEV